MAPRWLRWLTYAHDPEAHQALAGIQSTLDALAAQVAAALPVKPSAPMHHTATLDCGHASVSWATDSDGTTECSDCYEWRVRRQAHDPIFSVARTDDGWCVRSLKGVVTGPHPQHQAEIVCKAFNTMSNTTGRRK